MNWNQRELRGRIEIGDGWEQMEISVRRRIERTGQERKQKKITMKSISGRPSAGTLTERQIRIHESKSFIGLQNKRTIGTVHRLDNTLKFGVQRWTCPALDSTKTFNILEMVRFAQNDLAFRKMIAWIAWRIASRRKFAYQNCDSCQSENALVFDTKLKHVDSMWSSADYSSSKSLILYINGERLSGRLRRRPASGGWLKSRYKSSGKIISKIIR